MLYGAAGILICFARCRLAGLLLKGIHYFREILRMSDINKTERLDYLDSARGIAALMVMFGHLINWKYADKTVVQATSVLINANDAVSFFFVLSGMVLSYPYLQLGKKLDIGKFYVARIFRIYPGFWVALLAGILYANRYALNAANLVDVFIHNKQQFWEEFLLIRGHNVFYGAGWTLSYELLYSFLMPFLVVIAKQNKRLVPWFIWTSVAMAYVTGIFLFHFALGLFIAAHFSTYNSEAIKGTWWYRYRYPIIILALPMFSMRYWTKIFPIGGSTLHYTLDFLRLDFFYLSGLASFTFIICLIHYSKLRRIFQLPFLVYIGKISYGIYLVHWVLVCAMGDYWESRILPLFPGAVSALLVTAAVCFTLTIILASGLHYCIEIPFMKLGKKVIKKMKPTLEI